MKKHFAFYPFFCILALLFVLFLRPASAHAFHPGYFSVDMSFTFRIHLQCPNETAPIAPDGLEETPDPSAPGESEEPPDPADPVTPVDPGASEAPEDPAPTDGPGAPEAPVTPEPTAPGDPETPDDPNIPVPPEISPDPTEENP